MAKRKTKRRKGGRTAGRSGVGRGRYVRRSLEERISDLQAQIEELREKIQERDTYPPEAIRAERDRLELSAKDFGQLVGVSALTIYNWEKGRVQPRISQLQKLKKVEAMTPEQAWKKLGIV